jgi:hypothetical protein
MLVPAAAPVAVPVAEPPAEELPELPQAVTRIAAAATPAAAARDALLPRVNSIMLLYGEGHSKSHRGESTTFA